ncbi:histidine phosphatase family protein [Luteimonas fraxinea]|uniref:Histidine phosphatase family protein n=1 Tax=Luteimonas fraxinea TaxID=2901869 RepID=A0ABS8UCQ0_9GAMM|nr:histidine phosphatase family protein [Luteimonas fraxinea]MCD9096506.1 histidine phosphatase family protein [Luteimonas fraxinea]MCD9125848.1 histidine phosphatase family protein [Luteimonas fraxinea]
MPLREVYFVRHGESHSNAGGITLPHADIPLNETGRAQAVELIDRLPSTPSRILSSPFVRAFDTARPYARKTRVEVEQQRLLQEFDMIDPSLIAGMNQVQRKPIADAYWRDADPRKQMGENAESFSVFAYRVTSFISDALVSLPHNTVCFGHGIWMGMLAWQLLEFPAVTSDDMRLFRRFQSGFPMPNGVIYVLRELTPGEWALRLSNSSGHT